MTDEERQRRAELDKSFQTLAALCRKNEVKLNEGESLEESVQRLDLLLKKNQARLDELERNKPR
jgi:hypothetical protein